MNRIAILIISIVSLALAGCAAPPIKLDGAPSTKYTLKYSKLFVEDFTQDRKVSVNDVVWVNGWVPLFDGTNGPSPNKTLHRYLTESFTAGAEINDTLKISLLDSSYLMEKSFADDLAFVNLLSGQRERGFKCTASLNISNSQKSERKEFEIIERHGGFLEMDWLQGYTTRCRAQLVESISSYLQHF